MADINRRLKKAEKKLNVGGKQIIVRIRTSGDTEGFDLSNPVQQWLTYPEAVKNQQNGIITLSEYKEVAARRGAKLSNKEKQSNEYRRQD